MAWRRRFRESELTAARSLLSARLRSLEDGRSTGSLVVSRLPAVIAARALIADVAGSLPLVGVRDGRLVTPTPSLLLRPDPAMSRRRFVHRSAMSLTGWGRLYYGVLRWGANQWPLATEVLRPDTVAPEYDQHARISGWTVEGVPLEPDAVTYVPLWEFDLSGDARSPLEVCQQSFDDLAVLWDFASAYWREGGKPPYALKHETRLRGPAAGDALEGWLLARQQHRPGLLTGGWSVQDLPVPNASDALLLDGLAYIDATVCRVYGVTPSLLNTRIETGALTYSNAQDELRRWLNLSLYPTWLARIEDGLSAQLPYGQQAVFDTSHLGALGLERPGADEGRGSAPAPAPVAEPAVRDAGELELFAELLELLPPRQEAYR